MSTKTKPVSISMPDALARKAKAAAKANGMTLSEFLRAAIRVQIDNQTKKTK
jgi:metal-responsive CopG/Arc/MetJ family transcriptional regulator